MDCKKKVINLVLTEQDYNRLKFLKPKIFTWEEHFKHLAFKEFEGNLSNLDLLMVDRKQSSKNLTKQLRGAGLLI